MSTTVEFSCYKVGRTYKVKVTKLVDGCEVGHKVSRVDTLGAAVWCFKAARQWTCDSFEIIPNETTLKIARMSTKG